MQQTGLYSAINLMDNNNNQNNANQIGSITAPPPTYPSNRGGVY